MLRQFIAAEFKHGSTDDYYPDQVKKLTDLVNDWIENGDYTSIPKSIKEYFGTWVGEGLIRNSDYNAWKRLLNNSAAHKRGQTNRQQDNAVTLRNRLWILCKHVKRTAERRQHKINPETIDGYSQIMKSLEIFDKVHKELWPDYGLIPPPKLQGEKFTIDMGVDEKQSVRARRAAIEERLASQNNGKRRPSHSRKSSGESKTVSTKPDKLVKLKKQIRTFAREFNKLLNHPLAPAESKFMSAEGLKTDGSETYYELEPTDKGGRATKDKVFSGPSKGFEVLKPYAEKLLSKLSSKDKEDMIIFGWYWALGQKKRAKKYMIYYENGQLKYVQKTKYKWTSEEPFNTKNIWANVQPDVETPVRKPHVSVKRPPTNEKYKKLKKKYRELLQKLLKMIETDMLPKDWTQHKDDSGETYYFNSITGESQWEHP